MLRADHDRRTKSGNPALVLIVAFLRKDEAAVGDCYPGSERTRGEICK